MPDKHKLTAQNIVANNPQVWKAHQALTNACAQAGPLDPRTQRLIGLALAASDGSEGGVQFHVRRALNEGIGADELRHVALLAIPSLGFGNAVTILSWIDDLAD